MGGINLASTCGRISWKKNHTFPVFIWEKLKKIVGYDITLKMLDYKQGAGIIKLAMESSYIAAGAVLTQE